MFTFARLYVQYGFMFFIHMTTSNCSFFIRWQIYCLILKTPSYRPDTKILVVSSMKGKVVTNKQ